MQNMLIALVLALGLVEDDGGVLLRQVLGFVDLVAHYLTRDYLFGLVVRRRLVHRLVNLLPLPDHCRLRRWLPILRHVGDSGCGRHILLICESLENLG